MAQQTKRCNVYLDAGGQNLLASGAGLFSWNFTTYFDGDRTPETSVKVGEFLAKFPNRDTCVRNAVAKLREMQQDVRAEAEGKAMNFERQIQQLLAIEGPES